MGASSTGLPAQDIGNVEELLRVGELEVAFETLCTQLFEYDVALSAETVKDLVLLGVRMGMHPKYAQRLWECVPEQSS